MYDDGRSYSKVGDGAYSTSGVSRECKAFVYLLDSIGFIFNFFQIFTRISIFVNKFNFLNIFYLYTRIPKM